MNITITFTNENKTFELPQDNEKYMTFLGLWDFKGEYNIEPNIRVSKRSLVGLIKFSQMTFEEFANKVEWIHDELEMILPIKRCVKMLGYERFLEQIRPYIQEQNISEEDVFKNYKYVSFIDGEARVWYEENFQTYKNYMIEEAYGQWFRDFILK